MKGEILANINLHSVSFFDGNEHIWSFWTANPPHYAVGDKLYLKPHTMPEDFPIRRTIRGTVKEIFHTIEIEHFENQTQWYFTLEIYLELSNPCEYCGSAIDEESGYCPKCQEQFQTDIENGCDCQDPYRSKIAMRSNSCPVHNENPETFDEE